MTITIQLTNREILEAMQSYLMHIGQIDDSMTLVSAYPCSGIFTYTDDQETENVNS
jgi:hypothetical protein